MNPYTMARSTNDDGVIIFTFTATNKDAAPLILRPDDYQSGAAMRTFVLAWIASL